MLFRLLYRAIWNLGCCLLILLACSKNQMGTTEEIPQGLHAEINGIPWSATFASAIQTDSILVISGQDIHFNNLTIQLYPFHGEGTYTIPDEDEWIPLNFILYIQKAGKTVYGTSFQHTGTVAVKHYKNQRIEGTFSATLQNSNDSTDTITITRGTFSLRVTSF